jgi:hypothetical protein
MNLWLMLLAAVLGPVVLYLVVYVIVVLVLVARLLWKAATGAPQDQDREGAE